MPMFLVWQMAGPMASWGGIAVGEKRLSDSEPTRSALIGLLAACVGLYRPDEDNLMALSDTLGVASAVLDDPATSREAGPLRDYHTIQTAKPRGRKGQVKISRADELDGPGDTILSERYYLIGGMFLGCVWQRKSPLVPLQALAGAMSRPAFTPYLGRRSCPTGIPFAPRIIDAPGCGIAMDEYLADGRTASVIGGSPKILRLTWDMDAPGERPRADQRVQRRDLTVSFQRKHYVERQQGVTIASNAATPATAVPTEREIFDGLSE